MKEETNNKCIRHLGVRADYIVSILTDMCKDSPSFPIRSEYIGPIVDSLIDCIIDDLVENADSEDWDNDDVALAFSRSICKKLGIEV